MTLNLRNKNGVLFYYYLVNDFENGHERELEYGKQSPYFFT